MLIMQLVAPYPWETGPRIPDEYQNPQKQNSQMLKSLNDRLLFPFKLYFGDLEKEMATHSSTLPGKSHGWRSLVSYNPSGCKELDTTE